MTDTDEQDMAATAPTGRVEFCGERYPLDPDRPLAIGREADVVVDDNPYLHRRFLVVERRDALWWLHNVGGQLSATVADPQGRMQAYLAPQAALPLVFERTVVWFSAGPTTYDFEILLDLPAFVPVPRGPDDPGSTTIGRTGLTPSQRLLVLSLTEPALRRGGQGVSALPTSAQAAARLGWPLTKFNRKLDNVCQKLSAAGVRGLHGQPGRLAANRRTRLVEYALATRLVTTDDLAYLDMPDETDC